jgi:hypothetical protein
MVEDTHPSIDVFDVSTGWGVSWEIVCAKQSNQPSYRLKMKKERSRRFLPYGFESDLLFSSLILLT